MPEQTAPPPATRRPANSSPTDRRRHRPGRIAIVTVLLLVVAGLVVAAALFQPWRLFTQRTVVEPLPGAPAATAGSAGTTNSNGTAPGNGPVELSRGEFVSQEHQTRGHARVLRLADGSRLLRLEGLATSDGPDVKVWLTDAPATRRGADAVDAGHYLDLGSLKGTRGDQNYPIPADADLTGLRTVSIWCDRFNVSFGAAGLTPTG